VRLLKQTFIPAILVALTGICLPVALSFILIPLFPEASKLTAFAAGAALSSTSLGTTFAILSSVKLNSTRVGTVLVTAAMIDDVIGLVLVRVISQLGGQIDAGTIARPIGVSIAFLVVTILLSRVLKLGLARFGQDKWDEWRFANESAFVGAGVGLLGIGAAAGYAGTSILFAAYLFGVTASYLFPKTSLNSYQSYLLPSYSLTPDTSLLSQMDYFSLSSLYVLDQMSR
jgi:Kef-type K+ transport system membrane component KefB